MPLTIGKTTYSDEDIRRWWGGGLSASEIARDAAQLGATADQIAQALVIVNPNLSFEQAMSAVNSWVAQNPSQYQWSPTGALTSSSNVTGTSPASYGRVAPNGMTYDAEGELINRPGNWGTAGYDPDGAPVNLGGQDYYRVGMPWGSGGHFEGQTYQGRPYSDFVVEDPTYGTMVRGDALKDAARLNPTDIWSTLGPALFAGGIFAGPVAASLSQLGGLSASLGLPHGGAAELATGLSSTVPITPGADGFWDQVRPTGTEADAWSAGADPFFGEGLPPGWQDTLSNSLGTPPVPPGTPGGETTTPAPPAPPGTPGGNGTQPPAQVEARNPVTGESIPVNTDTGLPVNTPGGNNGGGSGGGNGGGRGGDVWRRFIDGTATTADWGDLIGRLGPSILGFLGANNQSNAQNDLYKEWLKLGEPYRNSLASLNADPISFYNSPHVQGALQHGTDAMARSLSAKVGNPILNPTALQEMQNYTTRGLMDMYNQRFGQLTTAGQLGLGAAAGMGQGAVNAQAGPYNAIGAGIQSVFGTDPYTQMAEAMRRAGLGQRL